MKLRTLFGAANRARLATYLLALWKLMKHPDTPRGPKIVAVVVLLAPCAYLAPHRSRTCR